MCRPSIWPSTWFIGDNGSQKHQPAPGIHESRYLHEEEEEPIGVCAVTWHGPERSLPVIPNFDINTPSAGAASDEYSQIPTEIEARDYPHETLDFHQEPFHDQQILPQGPDSTQVLNNHVQTPNGYAQNPKVANLDGSLMGLNGSLLMPTQGSHHHPVGMQTQPQPLSSLVYHGQAASSVPPYFGGMGPLMANTMSQPYSNNWDHNTAMGSPQAFQNQVYPMEFPPLPMQQQNSWAQDPTQMIHSQMVASFAPIPLTTPVVQRMPCSWPTCTESFTRPSDLQRHIEAVHLGIKYHCLWIGCPNNGGKGYCRAEKLRTHQRQKHGFA